MVRQTKAEGGDVIKIFATASIRDGGKQTMTDEQIAAVCGEAKAQGMRAVVHLYPADTARKVILAVCTGVEHGTFLDDATPQLMHDCGIVFDPNYPVSDCPTVEIPACLSIRRPKTEILTTRKTP